MKKSRGSLLFTFGLLVMMGLFGVIRRSRQRRRRLPLRQAMLRRRQQGRPRWMRYRLRWIRPVRRKVCWSSLLGSGLLKSMQRRSNRGRVAWPGWSFVLPEQRRGWKLMIFCARATRGRGLPSLDARSGRSISPHP